MLIQIVGTSGSGKSTLVRGVLKGRKYTAINQEDRSSPLGYTFSSSRDEPVLIVGAYEAQSSGGCDTFGGHGRVERLFDFVTEHHMAGIKVLFEGIMMMNHTRGIQLWNATKALTVLRLDVPLDVCIQSVRERRVAAGKEPDFTTKNMESNFQRCDAYCFKLRQIGCPVIKATREEAPAVLTDLLER